MLSRIPSFMTSLCFTIPIIILFTKGFLLTRHELDVTNSSQHGTTNSSTHGTISSYNETYKKVVIIVIDALRYDFARYYGDDGHTSLPFRNKLPIFKELSEKHGCSATKLFRFVKFLFY